MNSYKDNNVNSKLKIFKLWLGIVIIITMFYITISYLWYDDLSLSNYDMNKYAYLRSFTPAYPPPLVNFIN